MNNDELILEIIEKVHEQGLHTAKKVEEIQLEQARQGVIITQNEEGLREHMNRTANLEKRVAFYDSIAIIVAGIASVILFVVKVWPYVSHLIH
mgnify:FL=1